MANPFDVFDAPESTPAAGPMPEVSLPGSVLTSVDPQTEAMKGEAASWLNQQAQWQRWEGIMAGIGREVMEHPAYTHPQASEAVKNPFDAFDEPPAEPYFNLTGALGPDAQRGLGGVVSAIGAGMEQYGKSGMATGLQAFGTRQQEAAGPMAGPEHVWDIKGIKDAGEWFGRNMMQGIGSSVPVIVSGIGGTLAGGPLGGTAGVLGTAHLTGVGQVRQAFDDERRALWAKAEQAARLGQWDLRSQIQAAADQLDPDTQHQIVLAAGTIIGGLESVTPWLLLVKESPLVLVGDLKKQMIRQMVAHIGKRAAQGALVEGVTEAMQTVTEVVAIAKAKGITEAVDYLKTVNDARWRIFDEALAGAAGGVGLGGLGGVRDSGRAARGASTASDGAAPPPTGAGPGEPPPDVSRETVAPAPDAAPVTTPDQMEQAVELWRSAQAADEVIDEAAPVVEPAQAQAEAVIAALPEEQQAAAAPLIQQAEQLQPGVVDQIAAAIQPVEQAATAVPESVQRQLEQLGIAQARTEAEVREIMGRQAARQTEVALARQADATVKANAVQAYIQQGGRLDRARYADIARAAGIQPGEVPAALEAAAAAGHVRKTAKGEYRRALPAPSPQGAREAIAEAARALAPLLPRGTVVKSFAELADLPARAQARLQQQGDRVTTRAGEPVDAFEQDGTIYLAEYALDPKGRLSHEGVHALVTAGLVDPKEIAILAERARKTGAFSKTREERYRKDYQQRYPDDWQRRLDEEAAAHLIEKRMGGTDYGRQVNAILDRIIEFLDRLRNALRGRGFRNASDVQDAFFSGEMAARDPVQAWMRDNDLTALALGDEQSVTIEDKSVNIGAVQAHFAAMTELRRSLTDRLDVVSIPTRNNVTYFVVPKGKEIYNRRGNPQHIARFIVTPSRRDDVTGVEVTNARVDDRHQRQGIASAVYDMVAQDMAAVGGLSPAPRAQLSPDAQAFWQKRLGHSMFALGDERPVTPGLDMSPDARKQRAEAMGFDTSLVWYRGMSGDHPLRPYSYWTTSPDEASAYAAGVALTNKGDAANVIPAYMKRGRGRNIDNEVEEALFDDGDPEATARDIINKEKLDWVEHHHPSSIIDDDHLVRVVRDPSHARSPNAAFDPAHADSANLMFALADRDTGRQMRRAVDSLGFYSKLDEVLASLGPKDKVTLKTLTERGVKVSEIEARGLKPALDAGAVPVAELIAAAKKIKVELREVTYGGDKMDVIRRRSELEAERERLLGRRFSRLRYGERLTENTNALADLDQRAAQVTKWSAHSLDPSNKSYWETVLHLPGIEQNPQWIAISKQIDDIGTRQTELGKQFYTADSSRRAELDRLNDELIDQKTALADQRYELEKRLRNEQFTSGHFPEPNIIGHMQTSMVKHQGKPVYLIDQIQSDWGQKLRDGGVRDEAKIKELKAAKDAAWREYTKASDASKKAVFGKPGYDEIIARVQASDAEYRRIEAEYTTANRSAPGHPLVNTTDQWTTTTLRRALTQAVEADAEFIAIPHGDTVLSYNPGDRHGMNEFYNKIVPKNLRNILQKLDKEAPSPQFVDKLETPGKGLTNRGHMGRPGDKLGFTLFPITDAVKARVRGEGQMMFAFAGERAKTADLEALAKARQMDADGAKREAIWTETGWFKGVDGKWRFEIDDSGAKWSRSINEWLSGGMAPRFGVGYDRAQAASATGTVNTMQMLRHPELYSAYPSLAYNKLGVIRGDGPLGMAGVAEDGRSFTAIHENAQPMPARGALMHELGGHAVQHQEGFAPGGNKSIFSPAEIAAEQLRLATKQDNSGGWTSVGTAAPDDPISAAHGLYRRLAGEVEARTVQKRMDYTLEQRRARPPWLDYDVPEDQQIVRGAGGEGQMMFALGDERPVTPGLDMSPDARKQRAEAMGFDTSLVWYRGMSGDHPLRPYSYWTTSPDEASAYAAGVALTNKGDAANVIPAYMKRGRGRNIDNEVEEALFDDGDPEATARDIINKEQLDWVEHHHPSAIIDDDHLVRVVRDPSHARSPNAAFDPAHADSANLMLALGDEAYSGKMKSPEDVADVFVRAANAHLSDTLEWHDTGTGLADFDAALVDAGLARREGHTDWMNSTPIRSQIDPAIIKKDKFGAYVEWLDAPSSLRDELVEDVSALPKGMIETDMQIRLQDYVADDLDNAFAELELKDNEAVVKRFKQNIAQSLMAKTVDDVMAMPQHNARAAAFEAWLKANDIEYDKGRFNDVASAYFFVTVDPDAERIKVRFADHYRQSVNHPAADYNIVADVESGMRNSGADEFRRVINEITAALTQYRAQGHPPLSDKMFALGDDQPAASLQAIVSDLARDLGLTIRQGMKTATARAARRAGLGAVYDPATGIIRARSVADLASVASAAGQAVQHRLGARMDDIIAANAADLTLPAAPVAPPKPFAATGFSGLDLDRDTLARVRDAAVALLRASALNATGQEAGEANTIAERAMHDLSRRLGRPTAGAVVKDALGAQKALSTTDQASLLVLSEDATAFATRGAVQARLEGMPYLPPAVRVHILQGRTPADMRQRARDVVVETLDPAELRQALAAFEQAARQPTFSAADAVRLADALRIDGNSITNLVAQFGADATVHIRARVQRLIADAEAAAMRPPLVPSLYDQGAMLDASGVARLEARLIERFTADGQPKDGAAEPVADADDLRAAFAAWFKDYLLSPTKAEAQAPYLYSEMEGLIDASDPVLLDKLTDSQNAIAAYFQSDPVRQVKGGIRSALRPEFWERFGEDRANYGLVGALSLRASQLYTVSLDSTNSVALGVRELLDVFQRNHGRRLSLEVDDNPAKLMRLLPHSRAHTARDLENGVRNFLTGEHEGPGLIAGLVTALGQDRATARQTGPDSRYADFGAFLLARYAAVEWGRYRDGIKERPPTAQPPGTNTPDEVIAYYEGVAATLEQKYPAFVPAAEQIYEFRDNLLKLLRDGGVISAKDYDGYITDRLFMPMQRHFDESEDVSSSSIKRGPGGPLKRKRGSDRDVIDPIASLAQRAYEYRNLVAKNKVYAKLAYLAQQAGPGGGVIAEEIDATQLKAMQIDIESLLRKAAAEAEVEPRDVSLMLDTVQQMLGNDAIATSYTSGFIQPGKKPIVFFRRGGETVALQLGDGTHGHRLAKQMFDTLNTFGETHLDTIIELAALPAHMIRTNVVTHPEFQAANPVRDAMTAHRYDRAAWPVYTQLKGMIDVVRNAEIYQKYMAAAGMMGGEGTRYADKLLGTRDMQALIERGYRFKQIPSLENLGSFLQDALKGSVSGALLTVGTVGGAVAGTPVANIVGTVGGAVLGKTATQLALDRAGLGRNAASHAVGGALGGLTGAAVGGVPGAIAGYMFGAMVGGKALTALGELSETATREQLFKLAYDRAIANGLDEVAATNEAAFWAHDYTDYSRHGSRTRALAAMVPFLNANLQGNDSSARRLLGKGDQGYNTGLMYPAYRLGLLGKSMDQLSERERVELGNSAWAWFHSMFVLGGISLAFALVWDDDERIKDIDDRIKRSHWLLPVPVQEMNVVGKEVIKDYILRIPKPFEQVWISQLVERWVTEGRHGNSRWVQHYLEDLWGLMAPPMVPAVAQLSGPITGMDAQSGREIVPAWMKNQGTPLPLQYDAYTSEFGKWAGPKLDVAPMMVDHVITKFGATWGRTALSLNLPGTPWYNPQKPTRGPEEEFIGRRFLWEVGRGSEAGQAIREMLGMEKPWPTLWSKRVAPMTQYAARANEVRHLLEKTGHPDHAGAVERLEEMQPSERGYAVLEAFNQGGRGISYRMLHPMNRAEKIARETMALEKQLIGGELLSGRKGKDQKEIVLPPGEKKAARDMLTQLRMMEAHNALVLTGEAGWENRALFNTGSLLAELKAGSPRTHAELMRRYEVGHVVTDTGLRRVWPEVKARLEDPRWIDWVRKARPPNGDALFAASLVKAQAARDPAPMPSAPMLHKAPPGIMKLGGPPEMPEGVEAAFTPGRRVATDLGTLSRAADGGLAGASVLGQPRVLQRDPAGRVSGADDIAFERDDVGRVATVRKGSKTYRVDRDDSNRVVRLTEQP